ncbi:unnamed protein product [Lactuca virosa]|uniref:Uncharacterized protein n=1 Tax=Lactuca virosa TaxID=75947 RepID=A0AAU9M7Z0_9ASTR|nr:unnamed protein product [Lactuca virosa]
MSASTGVGRFILYFASPVGVWFALIFFCFEFRVEKYECGAERNCLCDSSRTRSLRFYVVAHRHRSKFLMTNRDPVVELDLVVYDTVLNVCTFSGQWKGVSRVFEEFRKSGLKLMGATYGIAMEVFFST